MNRVYLYRDNENGHHAGSKARDDAETIVRNLGYKGVAAYKQIKNALLRKIANFIYYRKTTDFSADTVVFNQYPDFSINFYKALAANKNKNGFKVITLVHDLSGRAEESGWNNHDMQDLVLHNSDVVIVHNEKMLSNLSDNGYSEIKMIPLGIFDYLLDDNTCSNRSEMNSIFIAGNLDPEKSGYLAKLDRISGVNINLFGPNYSGLSAENVKYFGSFPPEELIEKLEGGFGLVWDGDDIETCSGKTGQYLKINNPHKTSMCIAAGKPVIIWSQAALSDYVIKNNVGIVIDSLTDIPDRIKDITDAQYTRMLERVSVEREKVTKGYYLRTAVEKAEEML